MNEKLAAIANKMARSKLADGKLKEKLTQYTRPKNCEKLASGNESNRRDLGKDQPCNSESRC